MSDFPKIYKFFFLISTWLIIFLPISLVTGPFLSNLFATIVSLIYLFFFARSDYKYNFLFLIIFLIFIFYLFFISVIGESIRYSIETSISYLRYGFLILAISFVARTDRNFFKYFFLINFIAFLFLFLDLLIQVFFKKNLLGQVNGSSDRYTSFFGKEQILGSFVSRVLPILFFLINFLFKKKNSFLIVVIYFLSLIMILLSGERTSLALFIIFSLIVLTVKKDVMLLFKFLLIIILTTTFVFTVFDSQKRRFLTSTFNQIYNSKELNSNSSNLSFFSERHEYHFITALNIFKKNILFGSGPNSFRFVCDKPEYSVRNEILEKNTFRSKFHGYIKINNSSEITNDGIVNNDIKIYIVSNERIVDEVEIKKFSKILIKNNQIVHNGDAIFIKNIEHVNGCNTHPHNILIQLLSETGLIGTAFYIFFFFKILTHMFKYLYFLYYKKKRIFTDNYIYLLGGVLINFFPFITTGGFFNSWLCILFSIPIGFLFYIKNKNK